MEDIEDDGGIHVRLWSMHSMPSECMDGSMYHRQSRPDCHQLGRQTLAMSVTTALKALRGWRYVVMKVSNWAIAVFAGAIASTAVFVGPGMDLTVDISSSTFRITLTGWSFSSTWWNQQLSVLYAATCTRTSWVAAEPPLSFSPDASRGPIPTVEG